jgi:hypothetical protein
VLAAPIMAHDVMFTVFDLYSFDIFFTVKISFEGRGRG